MENDNIISTIRISEIINDSIDYNSYTTKYCDIDFNKKNFKYRIKNINTTDNQNSDEPIIVLLIFISKSNIRARVITKIDQKHEIKYDIKHMKNSMNLKIDNVIKNKILTLIEIIKSKSFSY